MADDNNNTDTQSEADSGTNATSSKSFAELSGDEMKVRFSEMEKAIGLLSKNNEALLAEKKASYNKAKAEEEKARIEREKAIEFANQNNEFKALSEQLNLKVQDLEGKQKESESFKTRLEAYESVLRADIESQMKALDKDNRKKLIEIYPEMDDLNAIDLAKAFDNISRFNRVIRASTPGVPGGVGDSRSSAQSKLDEFKSNKDIKGMLKLRQAVKR